MIPLRALALLPFLAACADATPEPALPTRTALPPPGVTRSGCAAHVDDITPLIGRPEAEVRAALSGMAGIRTLRVVGPNTPVTHDYRPDRATVLLRDGIAERIDCG